MGKWTDESRGNILDHDGKAKAGTYTDNAGVAWKVEHGGYLTGLPWSGYTAKVITPNNVYGLPTGKVLYTEQDRDVLQGKIDDACYAWRISKGDLKGNAPADHERKVHGAYLFAAVLAFLLLSKKGGRRG